MAKRPSPLIKVTKDGPYAVSGGVPMSKRIIVADSQGYSKSWKKGAAYPRKASYNLCRCGLSGNKPYCDGNHHSARFNGKETTVREPILRRAQKTSGPTLDLYDNIRFCASGRFCDRGKSVWGLTRLSADPKARKQAIQEACDCHAGRLIVFDKKTGKPIEPKLPRSIGVVEDPEAKVSGPLWVMGGIPVKGADGKAYEVRNRVTLCRCGKSRNKPFCDTSHVSWRFSDGDSSLRKKRQRR